MMEASPDESKIETQNTTEFSISAFLTKNWFLIIFLGIILVTILSRFYILGERTMSHDETSHVYFSWLLEQGRGYKHDPVTHGPLQFHLIALSYFLFGDNDFSARIPHALASIVTVIFLWNYRRYLGRFGWIIAALMMLISPYMLYYGRYARNEAFVALFAVIMFWAVFRYIETGANKYIFIMSASLALHFTAKETAYIYAAQLLIFLFFYLIYRISGNKWKEPEDRSRFLIALIVIVLCVGMAIGSFVLLKPSSGEISGDTGLATPTATSSAGVGIFSNTLPIVFLGLGLIAIIATLFFLIRGYGLAKLRQERSFDQLIIIGTIVLPMLAPFPVKMLGWDPLDYSSQGMFHTGIFLVPLAILAIVIGLWWNARTWLLNAAIFWGIYVVFYTTLFTNGTGFFTGVVGSLGYWLAQQGVNRGQQPWYYYIFIQIPIYEFLPAIGSIIAVIIALFTKKPFPEENPSEQYHEPDDPQPKPINPQQLAVIFFIFWAITSLFAYTYAGEKMPWLTVHIALPMIMLSGWSFGYLIEKVDWRSFLRNRGFVVVLVLTVFLLSLAGIIGSLLGTTPPFQGKQLEQLQASSTFLLSVVVAIASGVGLFYLLRSWAGKQIVLVISLLVISLLTVLTARTAYTASFINYNYANEYLVYAHSGPGAKLMMRQIEDISKRTTDSLDIQVAYDDKSTYPFWWYLRNYPNARFYGENPTRDLRELPIIIVGDKNYSKIEPIVGQGFDYSQYIRIWWPDMGYYNLTREDLKKAILDPAWRSALFQIWLNRDHTEYAQLKGIDLSLQNWQPSESMRLYIRKDIVSKIWNYGVSPSTTENIIDPYAGKEAKLTADQIIGSTGTNPGQFTRPRDLAIASDGSIYVADTENHRIQHLQPDGTILHTWGSFQDVSKGDAPGGTFYEPWGIAVAPDGSVYVADTWNNRIQKFTSDGEFIKMWGYFGQAEKPDAFWGPRDVAVDQDGNVLVSDTGNKRIAIFDSEGNFITQFGAQGFAPGEFDEQVGLALDTEGNLYVADTWNQRIQSFTPDGTGGYSPLKSWDVNGWFGQSLDNKPYIAIDRNNHVFITDPEGNRVIEFTTNGDIVRYWGDYSVGPDGINLAGSVAADQLGGVWVTDVNNGRVMHFQLPED